jgi:hypothetical protein
LQQNPIRSPLFDQSPICPICEQPTKERRHGMSWCPDCDAGWESPREYTRRKGLKPHEARNQLIGRRPWYVAGRPIVVSRKGRQS